MASPFSVSSLLGSSYRALTLAWKFFARLVRPLFHKPRSLSKPLSIKDTRSRFSYQTSIHAI